MGSERTPVPGVPGTRTRPKSATKRRKAAPNAEGCDKDMSGRERQTTQHADCMFCQYRDRSEWCVLDEQDLKLLDSAKVTREYLPGEIIYHEGDSCDGIHCVHSGMVGVRKSDAEGNSILLRLVYPGDTLGYRSFLGGGAHRSSAEVLKPSTICFIRRHVVRALLDRNPALGIQFLRHATKDLAEAEDKILHNATLSVRARFFHLLLVLKERYGTHDEDGSLRVELPLSRQDMAAMIGIRPESMSRTIRQVEDDGIARFAGRTVHIFDIDSLMQELEMATNGR